MNFIIRFISSIKRYLIRNLYLRNPINVYSGHKIYGNDSGLIANLVGNHVINQNRKKYNKTNEFSLMTKNIAKNLKNDGFAKIAFNLSEDIVNQLNSEFNKAIENLNISNDGKIEITSIDNPLFYKHFKSTQKIITNKIQDILECYYGSFFNVLNTHIYRTHYLDKKILATKKIEAYGSSEFWHNDGSTTDSIKLFILLNDINEDFGPMHIINKSDTKKLIKNGFYKYKEGQSNGIIEKTFDVTKLTGKKGDLFLADTNICLHRGDIPKTNATRDMLVFYIASSSIKFNGIDPNKSSKKQFLGFKRLFYY